MKRKIDFNYNDETGYTKATLTTKYGTFIGEAQIHPDDPFTPSYSVGMRIAEARAYINLYNKCIADKKIEIKGIKRLLNAIPKSEYKSYSYAEKLYLAMLIELNDLYAARKEVRTTVNETIRARSIYIRSRQTDREEKAKFEKQLQKAFAALSATDNKDKTD